jgi:hypothetical protein
MDFEATLQSLQQRIEALDRLLSLFAATLGRPRTHRLILERGFRYDAPDVRHFCLLKAVRVASSLNACIVLAGSGFTQEVHTLLRSIVECATQIDFVLDPNDSQDHREAVKKCIDGYFADSRRDPRAEVKQERMQQSRVHAALGRTLDGFVTQEESAEERIPAAKRYSNLWRNGSNYVHARYPETMDLYGGTPGQFHLRGMRGTPKEQELLEILDTYITTASMTFVLMVQRLDLRRLLEADFVLHRWYAEQFTPSAAR